MKSIDKSNHIYSYSDSFDFENFVYRYHSIVSNMIQDSSVSSPGDGELENLVCEQHSKNDIKYLIAQILIEITNGQLEQAIDGSRDNDIYTYLGILVSMQRAFKMELFGDEIVLLQVLACRHMLQDTLFTKIREAYAKLGSDTEIAIVALAIYSSIESMNTLFHHSSSTRRIDSLKAFAFSPIIEIFSNKLVKKYAVELISDLYLPQHYSCSTQDIIYMIKD